MLFQRFLTALQGSLNSKSALTRLLALFALTTINNVAFAQVGGLNKAKTTLDSLLSSLEIVLPIAAVIIGVIIFVLYSAEVMRKDDAIRWGIGVVLAGSVAELVVLLWK